MFVGELQSIREAAPGPDMAAQLADVTACVDAKQQLDMLKRLPVADAADVTALWGFAGDTMSSSSVYVRAYALEKGVRSIPEADREQAIARQFGTDAATWYVRQRHSERYQQMAAEVGQEEGVVGRLCYVSELPQLGLLLAEAHLQQAPQGQDLQIENMGPLTARNILQSTLNNEPISQIDQAYAKLSRYTPEALRFNRPMQAADNIRRLAPESTALAYANTLNNLYDSAAYLADAFPGPVGEQAVRAARELVGATAYTLSKHMEQGQRTTETFHLLGGRKVPFRMYGDRPLELLRALDTAFTKLGAAVTDPTIRPVSCVDSQEFSLYRFISTKDLSPPTVKLYIRPKGEQGIFDTSLEFGRPRKGVDASIGYTIQLSDDQPVSLSKHGLRLDTICIRVDRDSRHPDDEDGWVSLDIGSIAGPADSLGTEIAAFLACGDMSATHWLEHPGTLNHARLGSRYGQEDMFAQVARECDRHTRQKLMELDELEGAFYVSTLVGAAAMADLVR